MTDVLNLFDLLDPSRALRDIDAAKSTHFFDKWAELDPRLALARINAAYPDALIDGLRGLDPYLQLKSINSALGGSAYTAKAVHFDGAVKLINAAVASSDSGVASFAQWFRVATFPDQYYVTFSVDPSGAVNPGGGNNTTFNIQANGTIEPTFGPGANNDYYGLISSPTTTLAWHHVMATVDFRKDPPLIRMREDDVDVDLSGADDGRSGFLTTSSKVDFNGLPLWVGSDDDSPDLGGPFPFTGDMADFWIAPGVSLLDETGDIPLATRRLFIDGSGKPVNPSGFPAGGAVLLSGDHTTFATNQGTGGAFTVTGTLTNATTSPSD